MRQRRKVWQEEEERKRSDSKFSIPDSGSKSIARCGMPASNALMLPLSPL